MFKILKISLILFISIQNSIASENISSHNLQRTLSIIKPDAVKHKKIDQINAKFQKNGLKIISQKKITLTREQAESFYAEHRGRKFFKDLIEFMTSGPSVIQVLEGNNAVKLNRKIMGATNPQKAEQGTIRHEFGTNVQQNAVHGSDSEENAKREIEMFFQKPQHLSKMKTINSQS